MQEEDPKNHRCSAVHLWNRQARHCVSVKPEYLRMLALLYMFATQPFRIIHTLTTLSQPSNYHLLFGFGCFLR